MSARWRSTVAGIGAIVVASVTYALGQPRAAPPGAEAALGSGATIRVVPFATGSGAPDLADLRDGVQNLLADALTVDGSFRAAAAPSDAVTTGERAELNVVGTIDGTPGHLTIDAMLGTTPGAVPRAQARVEGSADSLTHLVERLATRLLAMHAGRDDAERAALGATSLAALHAYLAGTESARRGRPREATEQYLERAAALDSSFALAMLQLAALGDVHGTRGVDEHWKFEAAWNARQRLGVAERALLTAHLGPRYPGLSTLAERIAAGVDAARAAPHRAEAWFIAGENLRRYGSLVDHPEWEAQAVAAFERALALDSTNAQTLDRLLILAAGRGDRDAVRRHAVRYLAHNPSAEAADFVRWRAAVALRDDSAQAALRRRFPQMTAISLQRIVLWSQEDGAGVADGLRAATAMLDRANATAERRVALNRMVRVLLNQGRPRDAAKLLAESEAGFGPSQGMSALDFRIYSALFWDGDTADAGAAVRRLEAIARGARAAPRETPDRQSAACALAQWHLAAGMPARAEETLARMRDLAVPDDPLARSTVAVCTAIVRAQLATQPGGSRTVARQAIEHLDSLLLAQSNSRDLVYTVGNIVAARLMEAHGEPVRALAIARRRAGWNAFLSTQLREEGRLAARTGDREGALRAYRRYVELRTDPEPLLGADVDGVRAEISRLETSDRPPG